MPTIAEVRAQYPQYSDMSDEHLANALHTKFYSDLPREQFNAKIGLQQAAAAPVASNTAADVAKSTGIGVVKGTIGLAGALGDLTPIADKALRYLKGIVPGAAPPIEPQRIEGLPEPGLPTSAGIQSKIENVTGKFYEPQTRAGQVAQTVGEFAPGMIGGAGGLGAKFATRVAVPALASEGAGELTKGTAVEPYARAGAAVLGSLGATAAARAPAQIIGNLGTHTGEQSINTAYRAGMKGGTAGEAFREQLRGGNAEEVVADAKTALANLRQQKNADYQAGMTGIHNDQTVLDFAPIDRALQNVQKVKTFKGQELSGSTQEVRTDIAKAVGEWRKLDPKEYHTPAGFDALKQAVGDIKDSLPYNTPQRLVAEQVYSAIRDTITKQAPSYANVMKGYETAAKQITEIEKTLSLGKKATTDTALRKLQSVMRDNVNTNYGKRADLAQSLANNGAPDLMEKLAGQANASWVPRGLGKIVAPIVMGSGYLNPLALATLPLMSPRLMAETVHGMGRIAGGANAVRQAIGLPIAGGRSAPPARAAIGGILALDPEQRKLLTR